MDKPLISVCTPVYNGERYMHTIIGSFLSQTFKECEMVIADNWSTDSTCDIVKHYQEKYPGRIRLVHTDKHYDYPAKGRYLAVLNAEAEYIYMCDADDEIDCRALERLYNAAMSYKRGGADIAIGSANCIRTTETGEQYESRYKIFKNQVLSNDEACVSGPEFWNKLIRRELYLKCGEIPECVFDDASYIPGLMSYAKSIVSISNVVYYYHRTEDGLSANGTGNVRLTLETIQADRNLLSHHNPKYTDSIVKYIAMRMQYNIKSKWMFMDYYIDELNEHIGKFLASDNISSQVIDEFRGLLRITGGHIPNIIYLNGFTHEYTEEEITEIQNKALTHECLMVVLQPDDPDADEIAQRMITDGDLRGAAQYLALKKICETGGYFIDDCVKINNPLNFCRCFGSFVGLEDKKTYNDHVFGAQPGNELFCRVMETYRAECLYGGYSLGERLRLILVSEYGLPTEYTSDKIKYIGSRIAVLPENYLTISDIGKNLTEIDYSRIEAEDLVLVRRSTIDTMLEKNRNHAISVSGGAKKTNSSNSAQQELDAIYQSNTWKIVMKLRKIGDGPMGPFLKKIYRAFTKLKNRKKKKVVK